MPRKPHRPPSTATKRRKLRKTAIPYEFEGAPEPVLDDEALEGEVGWEAESLDDSEARSAIATEERELTRAGVRPRDAHERAQRHVSRDYSYVRGEVIRIAVIGGVLILALVIVAILR